MLLDCLGFDVDEVLFEFLDDLGPEGVRLLFPPLASHGQLVVEPLNHLGVLCYLVEFILQALQSAVALGNELLVH